MGVYRRNRLAGGGHRIRQIHTARGGIRTKACSALLVAACAAIMILGFTPLALGATSSVQDASAFTAQQAQVSSAVADLPCPQFVGCVPDPACDFVGGCQPPCPYNCHDPNDPNIVQTPVFAGQGERNNPNNYPAGNVGPAVPYSSGGGFGGGGGGGW